VKMEASSSEINDLPRFRYFVLANKTKCGIQFTMTARIKFKVFVRHISIKSCFPSRMANRQGNPMPSRLGYPNGQRSDYRIAVDHRHATIRGRLGASGEPRFCSWLSNYPYFEDWKDPLSASATSCSGGSVKFLDGTHQWSGNTIDIWWFSLAYWTPEHPIGLCIVQRQGCSCPTQRGFPGTGAQELPPVERSIDDAVHRSNVK
jgi:hypothetical protein